MTSHPIRIRALATLAAASAAALLGACASLPGAPAQPVLGARAKPVLTVQGLSFKDLNGNGVLDAYEDWRLPVDRRVDDLVARLTLHEKAGLMLVQTLNGACEGALPPRASQLVNQQQMHRFIIRNVINTQGSCAPDAGIRAGSQLTPQQAARFTNSVQALAEATRLGIPVLFKSNARNHFERDARSGINNASGALTEFPKEAGIAAAALGQAQRRTGQVGAGDMAVVKTFASVMGQEWQAVGIRGMYGYMADLATEPRWFRVHETFTEDADLAANILGTLVTHLQGGPLNPRSPVALTIKHFPGGGPQELGLDPHYAFGRNQVYPAGNFGGHLKPFQAAIDAGVASVMPYYGVPINVTYQGVTYEQTGMAFSRQIVTDLLRGKLGFQGYVNSDTGIINDRAWGLEGLSVPQRVAAAIHGGTDTLSGFDDAQVIIELVKTGLVSEARVTEAARRLLKPLFQMGLFENPYVDEDRANQIVGQPAFREAGLDVQRQSVVLLQNTRRAVPVPATARVYTLGIDRHDALKAFAQVTDGEAGSDGKPLARDAAGLLLNRPSAAGHDRAIIRVEVSNVGTSSYRSRDPATGANPAWLNPLTGQVWGAQDPCITHPAQNPSCVDDGNLGGPVPLGLVFGGALPWEAGKLSFTTMAASKSWRISPALADIQAVMKEIGPDKVVLSINFRQPYVIDEASGLRSAGALVAGMGVSNTALLDVLSGRFKPQGRLPFSLARTLQAIHDKPSDAAGYPAQDTLFPFGFGLSE